MNIIQPVTTKKEIKSWYLYDFANSVFATPSLAMFIPILLDKLTTQKACSNLYNDTNGEKFCDDNGHYLEEKLFVNIGLFDITPESFAFAVLGISVLFQAVFFISFGAYADYGKNKKRLLTINTIAGSVSAMGFILFYEEWSWFIVGCLTIVANILFGLAIVYYNAYLPLLVRNHGDYINANTDEKKMEIEDNLSNKISTYGFMWGYSGSLIATILTFIIIVFYPNTTNRYDDKNTNISICLCIFFTGLWWLVFGLISISGLQEREGEEFPDDENWILFSWKRTYLTIKQLKNHKNIKYFMISYFLYSDAYSTISSCGILYAKRELNVTQLMLTILLLEVTLCSVVGNYFFLVIQRKFKIRTKCIITFHLISYLLLSIFGLFYLTGNISLLIFGFIHGFLIGAVQSFTRTLFVQLIPSGLEAQFFSLYEISDKGSSWIGPIVLAVISQFVSIRYGFIYIVGMLFISTIILQFVNVSKNFENRDEMAGEIAEEVAEEVV
jgi:UMF1 family MFS transporter